MYIRPVHAELDLPTLHAFIRANPLGLLTTSIPHASHATLQTSHIPFTVYSEGEKGTLRGHMARPNPQVKAMIDSVRSRPPPTSLLGSVASALRLGSTAPESNADDSGPSELDDEVLVLFNAPVHSYVTPSFYTSTKPSTGAVVPTWNYAAVQIYGKLKLYYSQSPSTSSFLQRQVEDLSNQREGARGGSWKVADAPVEYVDGLKRGIVGLEIQVTRCEGRFKLSQEMGEGDWRGVVQGFRAMGTEWGDQMARMVEERGSARGVKIGDAGEDEAVVPKA